MPPVNDTFPGTTISGGRGSTTGSNVGATLQAGEPAPTLGDGTNTASVWWTWTAPSSGDFIFDLSVSALADTTLEVFTGSSVGALTLVASDDDSGSGFKSKLTLTAVSGTTYRFRVMGYAAGDEGAITIDWHKNIPVPTISSRTPSSGKVGTTVTITGTNFSAVDTVTFAGVPALFTIDSSTQITATVPNGATGINSPIDVGNDGGTVEYVGFTPLYPGPWIQPDDRWWGVGAGDAGIGGTATLDAVIDHSGFEPVYVRTDSTEDFDGGPNTDDFAVDLDFLPPVLPPSGSWPPGAFAVDSTETPHGTALGPYRATLTADAGFQVFNLGVHADLGVSDSGVIFTVSGAASASLHWTAGPAHTFTVDNDYVANEFIPPVVVDGDIADGTSITIEGTLDFLCTLTAGPSNPVEQSAEIDAGVSVDSEVLYRPPRYRFLYPHPLGRPPLAHRQRRDGVATVGPPLAHLQGAVSGTRPDLAHRQQTP